MLIIHFGAFHTMCSYMGSMEKMILDSGFEDIVIEGGVCASGSISKVISSKHYNRAMHTHLLVMDAIERLVYYCSHSLTKINCLNRQRHWII